MVMEIIKVGIGKIASTLMYFADRFFIHEAEKASGCKINYFGQGPGGVQIGNPQNFKIDPTSHLKSATFIEAEGGGIYWQAFPYRKRLDNLFKQP